MIVKLDWSTFQMKYLDSKRIFVIENDDSWELTTSDEIVLAVRPISGSTSVEVEGGLTWREML